MCPTLFQAWREGPVLGLLLRLLCCVVRVMCVFCTCACSFLLSLLPVLSSSLFWLQYTFAHTNLEHFLLDVFKLSNPKQYYTHREKQTRLFQRPITNQAQKSLFSEKTATTENQKKKPSKFFLLLPDTTTTPSLPVSAHILIALLTLLRWLQL